MAGAEARASSPAYVSETISQDHVHQQILKQIDSVLFRAERMRVLHSERMALLSPIPTQAVVVIIDLVLMGIHAASFDMAPCATLWYSIANPVHKECRR
jgi:hypothetical protein